MNTQALKVFYDGSCKLCSAEIDAIRAAAAPEALAFIDCSAPDFDETPFLGAGVDRAAMMRAMHVRDANGTWHRGVDAFAQLYGSAGLPEIARFWGNSFARPLLQRLYPWVVRNRYWLSRLGLPGLTGRIVRHYAAKAQRRSRRCANGNCSLN
jgi:predicted DCC family thiol-disulfide oxidoreductase YuxK